MIPTEDFDAAMQRPRGRIVGRAPGHVSEAPLELVEQLLVEEGEWKRADWLQLYALCGRLW